MLKTASIILAGGLSSRMQKNKAFIKYKNRTLLEIMLDLLNTPLIEQIFISGNLDNYPCNYPQINDPKAYQGPAKAIINCVDKLNLSVDQLLFIPIDMPIFNKIMLEWLLLNTQGSYFAHFVLPIKISTKNSQFIKQSINNLDEIKSIKDLINDLNLKAIKLPCNYEKFMLNINTPLEYQKLIQAKL